MKKNMQKIDILIFAAKNPLKVCSTIELGKRLGISQQSVSRILIHLEKEGLIERSISYKGLRMCLTYKGRSFLLKYKKELDAIFVRRLKGVVCNGSGEGRFYTSIPCYKNQFISKLGIDPYPGTLNLIVDEFLLKQFLALKKEIIINGFKTKKREFGKISCYLVKAGGVDSALVVPERTHHPSNIVEIISEKNLRATLKLHDGSEVEIE
ncbi:MAG: DUF120 domain-containing protein [Candidatus Woesearchaeota archaeon]